MEWGLGVMARGRGCGCSQERISQAQGLEKQEDLRRMGFPGELGERKSVV